MATYLDTVDIHVIESALTEYCDKCNADAADSRQEHDHRAAAIFDRQATEAYRLLEVFVDARQRAVGAEVE